MNMIDFPSSFYTFVFFAKLFVDKVGSASIFSHIMTSEFQEYIVNLR